MELFDFILDDVVPTKPIRIGVLSDTHVPDRVGDLHPDILPSFKELNVDLIIHAGDICIPAVLQKLEEVAPVVAVQGNRDWWRIKQLPSHKIINIKEVKILITHGHGQLFTYLWDKVPYWLLGYRFERFVKKFSKWEPDFDIVIFGHSHRAENQWVGGRLYFNPGSAYEPMQNHQGATIGLLEISERKTIDAKIVFLRELGWRGGKWIEKNR
jgi:hypothetical protein